MKLNAKELPSVLVPYISMTVDGRDVKDRCQSVTFEDDSISGPTLKGKGEAVCLVPSSKGGFQFDRHGMKTVTLKGTIEFRMFSVSPKIIQLWTEYVKGSQAGSATA